MAIGWNPRVVEQMTLWEIVAAVDGHNRAQSPGRSAEQVEPPTDAEFDRMLKD